MTKKTFYKYKSIENFEFLLDIVLKERLYASHFSDLNDPMEGVVETEKSVSKNLEKEWEKIINDIRICCFTPDPDNTLMWAHYANGGRGCIIEFELTDENVPYKISYTQKPKIKESDLTQEKAIQVLQHKDKNWKYEREFRCLTQDKFIPIIVKRLILGSRVSDETVALLRGIISCCKPKLTVVQIKGKGDSLFKSFPVEVRTKRTYRTGLTKHDNCLECYQVNSTRNEFLNYRHKPTSENNKRVIDIIKELERSFDLLANSSDK